jgi:hypothetical protein
MLPFFGLRHVVIVDPTPSVADDLVTVSKKSGHRLRALLHPAHDPENADFDVELFEDSQQAPHAHAGSVLEDAFDDRTTYPVIGRKADIVQHVFGLIVPFQKRTLAPSLEVKVEVDRNARIAWPVWVRGVRSVTEKIPRRA